MRRPQDLQRLFYHLGLAFLFTHELDAVTHSEWRLLFVLRDLPSTSAAEWFVALHVPLFFCLLWLGEHPRESLREWTRRVVAAFFVVHGLLHFRLSTAPENEFEGLLSSTLIASAAACGAAYLLSVWLAARRAS